MATARPIFIHSLFRPASTHFVQKFRAIEAFSCYQEPFNESLAALNGSLRRDRLSGSPGSPGSFESSESSESSESPAPPDVRHRRFEPDFSEFWAGGEHLRGLFRPSFAYGHYFAPDDQLPPAQQAWLSAIIEQAPARPVLQLCRSAGRAAAMRRIYGGTHLHLWREPRAHWWAYKIADYFDTQRIYRSARLPEALRQVRRLAGMPRWRLRHPPPRGDYMLFYGLWLDAWLRLCANCDLTINVDRVVLDPAEKAEFARRLAVLIGCTIDLSDIRAPGMLLTPEEEPFYAQVEEAVHQVFARTGHAATPALQIAAATAASARSVHDGRPHDIAAEQNLRLAAISLMHSLAGGGRPGGGRWPHRWYPKRLHDYLRWALRPQPQRQSPPIGYSGTAGGEDAARRAAVQSPPGQPS